VTTSYIIKQADESRTANDTFSDDSELTLALLANSTYWIHGAYIVFGPSDFGHATYCRTLYTGTVLDDSCIYTRYSYVASVGAFQGAASFCSIQDGILDFQQNVDNSSGNTSTFRGHASFTGFVKTNSAGNLKLNWTKHNNGAGGAGNASIVYAGSYLAADYIEPNP